MQYGGFWIRLGAYLIDFVIMIPVAFIIFAVTGTSFSEAAAGASTSVTDLLNFVVGIAYFVGFESSSWQATPGKKALGLIVTDSNGSRITVPRAIGRYFAKILSALILLIGFIMVAFTDRKQGLHDMIAGTLVVKGQPGMAGVDTGVFE